MKLKDICKLFTDGDWIESKDQSDKGIRLVQTGNIGIGKYLEKEGREKYISQETFEEINCTEIYPGDILISRLPEPVGRGCIIPETNERMITAVDCTICRINDNLIDKRYFCYYLQSSFYYNQLLKSVTGTTRKRISRKNLGDVDINIPNRTRQIEIVRILDNVMMIIDSRKQQLQRLDELVKARFVEMFGDRFINDKQWNTSLLSECVSFHNGKAHEQVVDDNGEYILVTSKAIATDFKDVRKTNALLYPLNKHDIVMVMSDVPNGRALAKCQLIERSNKFTLNQRICSFDNYDFNPLFLLHLLNRHKYFLDFNDGNGQTNLRKDDILNCVLIVPPNDLQNQFAVFVEQVDKSKVAVQKALDEAQTLFDSLMQQYFG